MAYPSSVIRGLSATLIGGLLAASTTIAAGQTDSDPMAERAKFARPDTVPYPADDPYSDAKAQLGEMLFNDVRLSGDGSVACASCHQKDADWQDGVDRHTGLNGQPLPRRTPTLWNMAWGAVYFWDGRAPTLEQQVLGPMRNEREMAQSMPDLIRELTATTDYPQLFAAAFPAAPEISEAAISQALATYLRTIVSPPAPFDRWVGGDEAAISDTAKRGFGLFTGKANCATCHSGWNFTDQAFHDIGLNDDDRGRGAVLNMPKLDHAFKTPTLRNVARRPPFMHDGSVTTLAAVIDHYADHVVKRPTLSRDLKDIVLTAEERADLVAFLETLTSDASAAPVRSGDAAPVAAAASSHVISQKDLKFSSDALTLSAGDNVSFVNDDNRYHNVIVSGPDTNFDSGAMEPGAHADLQFDTPGNYDVTCLIHPTMHLTITVK